MDPRDVWASYRITQQNYGESIANTSPTSRLWGLLSAFSFTLRN